MSTPGLGVQGSPFLVKGEWQASLGWRYQKSDEHFVGDDFQEERTEEGSEVVNRVHLADVTVRHAVSDRVELSVGVPYLMATRSSTIRNASRVILGRYTTQARGIGDITVTARRWMLDPSTCKDFNFTVGLGLKLPTGQDNATDTFQIFQNGAVTTAVRTVDQSIQPGDGGFGFVLDVAGFKRFARNRVAVYAAAAYLFNPETTNGVPTYRGRASEAEMSVADQYLVRLGVSAAVPWVDGLSVGLGGRWEGVPPDDAFGSSVGFRRPGYSIGIDPSISYGWSGSSVFASVPFALYRNRLVSVPDRADNAHGDAAFAPWVLFVGYSHRF